MVATKAKRGRPRKPAEEPLLLCPFTGSPVEIVRTSSGNFLGRVSAPYGGYTTRLFSSKQELLYFLSARDGVEPSFPRTVKIEVRDREPPSSDPLSDVKEMMEGINDEVDNVVESVVGLSG